MLQQQLHQQQQQQQQQQHLHLHQNQQHQQHQQHQQAFFVGQQHQVAAYTMMAAGYEQQVAYGACSALSESCSPGSLGAPSAPNASSDSSSPTGNRLARRKKTR